MGNEFSEVFIGVREPFDKSTLWIYPHDREIDIKIFDKGWRIVSTTKDQGLSTLAETQVKNLVEELNININDKIKKQLGQYISNMLDLKEREKILENKISELESKYEKLAKRYANLSVKLK